MYQRIARDGACKWCKEEQKQGEHYYDINFARHEHCRCAIINTGKQVTYTGDRSGVWNETKFTEALEHSLSNVAKKYNSISSSTKALSKNTKVNTLSIRDVTSTASTKVDVNSVVRSGGSEQSIAKILSSKQKSVALSIDDGAYNINSVTALIKQEMVKNKIDEVILIRKNKTFKVYQRLIK